MENWRQGSPIVNFLLTKYKYHFKTFEKFTGVCFVRLDPDRRSLLHFDDVQKPEEERQVNWGSWGKRAVSVACVAGSATFSVMNAYRTANAFGYFAIGLSGLYCVSSIADEETKVWIRKVLFVVMGQTSIFAFSQAYANDDAKKDKEAFVRTIMVLFGANVELIRGWFWDQGIQAESQEDPKSGGRKLDSPWINKYLSWTLKAAIAGGFIYFRYEWLQDPILQGFALFLGSFLASQVLGEVTIDLVNRAIEKRDVDNQGTYFRVAKNAILTSAFLGQMGALIPWAPRHSQNPWAMGPSIGSTSGILDRSLIVRAQKIPVEELDELGKLQRPQYARKWGVQKVKYCAYWTWKIAVPTISLLGVLGFGIWNLIKRRAQPITKDEQVALGALVGGYWLSSFIWFPVDWIWSPTMRGPILDKMMTMMWLCPRVFGIDPLFVYFAVTNSLKMDGEAIESGAEGSNYRLWAVFAAWFCYSFRMAQEVAVLASDRLGKVQANIPKMALINAALTMYLYIKDDN